VIALPTSAQNLLTNGAFNSDLSGWSVQDNENVATRWDSQDAGGSPNSGSVSVTNQGEPSGVLRSGATQCVNLVPGGRYRFRGDVLIPSGQSEAGWTDISLFFFSAENCNNGFITGTGVRADQRGSWQQASMDMNVPTDARSVRVGLGVNKQEAGGALQAFFDRIFVIFQSAPACVVDDQTLCLNGGRFKVTANWTRPSSETGQGTAVALTQDTGYFWFFRDTNVEMIVKVLSGCSNNNHFWVFAGGLTNVGVELRVEDSETGQVQTYINPVGEPLQPVQDTFAFATCP